MVFALGNLKGILSDARLHQFQTEAKDKRKKDYFP